MRLKKGLMMSSCSFLLMATVCLLFAKSPKETSKAPAELRLLQSVEFRFQMGGFGESQGKFQYPTHIGSDAAGNIYVPDTGNHRIQVFSPQGNFRFEFGQYGYNWGEFNFPVSAEVDSKGDIYVADMANHRIQVFDSQGNFIRQIGSYGETPGYLQCPYGFVIDEPEGIIYIADTMAHRIQKFTLDGQYVTHWGEYGRGMGQFHFPRSIAISPKGELYISDTANNRIQVFTKDGQYLREFGEYGVSMSLANVSSAAVAQFGCPDQGCFAANGNFYVADMLNHRVAVFDETDTFIGNIGGYGKESGQLAIPKGLTMGPNGEVWVAHSANHAISKFIDSSIQSEQIFRRR